MIFADEKISVTTYGMCPLLICVMFKSPFPPKLANICIYILCMYVYVNAHTHMRSS